MNIIFTVNEKICRFVNLTLTDNAPLQFNFYQACEIYSWMRVEISYLLDISLNELLFDRPDYYSSASSCFYASVSRRLIYLDQIKKYILPSENYFMTRDWNSFSKIYAL